MSVMRWLLFVLLLVGCKKDEKKPRGSVPATINDAGVVMCPVCEEPRECGKGVRDVADARVEAAYMLGKPVICDESPNNGVTCWDTRGATVWCPKDLAEPCHTTPTQEPKMAPVSTEAEAPLSP